MKHRREFNKAIMGAMGLAMGAGMTPAVAAAPDRKFSPDEKPPSELMTEGTIAAIDRGLNFLLRNQIKTGRNRGAYAATGLPSGVATASMAGLAMMCGGHAPGFDKFGKAIDNLSLIHI